MGKNYWMVVVTPQEFQIIKDQGYSLYAMRAKYRRRAERMQPGDRVLLYVSGLRKWPATATIASRYYEDHSPIWTPDEDFPFRVKLAPNIVLEDEDYIDALLLAPRLEYVKRWPPEDWPLAFYDSLHLLPQKDFRLVEGEMKRIVTQRRRAKKAVLPPEEEATYAQDSEEALAPEDG